LAIDDERRPGLLDALRLPVGSPIGNDHRNVPTSGGVFASHQGGQRAAGGAG
jgi:hypothetical protein